MYSINKCYSEKDTDIDVNRDTDSITKTKRSLGNIYRFSPEGSLWSSWGIRKNPRV